MVEWLRPKRTSAYSLKRTPSFRAEIRAAAYHSRITSDCERPAADASIKKLSEAFSAEAAVKAMSDALSNRRCELEEAETSTEPSLTLVSRRFEEVVAKIQVLFEQGPADIERGLEALSEGHQSLFYFALAAAVFDLERDAVSGRIKGFRADELHIPALSIFAIEEPENHLPPYYLSRIVRQVRSIIEKDAAQALVTSHAALYDLLTKAGVKTIAKG